MNISTGIELYLYNEETGDSLEFNLLITFKNIKIYKETRYDPYDVSYNEVLFEEEEIMNLKSLLMQGYRTHNDLFILTEVLSFVEESARCKLELKNT